MSSSLLRLLVLLLPAVAARGIVPAFVPRPDPSLIGRSPFAHRRAAAASAPGGWGGVAPSSHTPPRRVGVDNANPVRLTAMLDPHDAIHHAQTAADLLSAGGGAGDHPAAMASAASTAVASASSSSSSHLVADAAAVATYKPTYTWEFLWWHGPRVNPMGEDVSVPPLDLLQNPVRDYFLPTEDPKAAAEAIKNFQQTTEGGASAGPMVGIEPSQFRDSLPGGSPEFFFDGPGFDSRLKQEPLDADDLEEILHDGDILSRLPLVAFTSVLIDFWFVNTGRDVYRDEIENDEEALRAEWVQQVVPRLGIGIVMALLTIASSYIFYHPI